jgi:hypothetical protein
MVDYHKFTYWDVIFDAGGWADPNRNYPRAFDMVLLQLENRCVKGWWDGREWDGYRLLPSDKVFYWKKTKDL